MIKATNILWIFCMFLLGAYFNAVGFFQALWVVFIGLIASTIIVFIISFIENKLGISENPQNKEVL